MTEQDLGNHFFLSRDSLGKPRGESMLPFLLELNEEVQGHVVNKSPNTLIEHEISFLKKFDIILATKLSLKTLLKLSQFCWKESIPLVLCSMNGFFGYMRIIVPEHSIVETHPEQIVDLRLDQPFPELLDYLNEFDFDRMDSMEHGHVPYAIILLKCLQDFRNQHDGQLPKNQEEKNHFKSQITALLNLHPKSDSENFQEALSNAYRAWTPTRIPDSLQSLLKDPLTMLSPDSSPFWILVSALSKFVQTHDRLPYSGFIPDMKADTESFVSLQIL